MLIKTFFQQIYIPTTMEDEKNVLEDKQLGNKNCIQFKNVENRYQKRLRQLQKKAVLEMLRKLVLK